MRVWRLFTILPRCPAICLIALAFIGASQNLFADTPPQFSFTINSNQIPGGIYPLAVGTDEAGKIYISSGSSVFQMNTNGTLLNRWGTQGSAPGQFSYAGQQAFDHNGHVFVLDAYNNRVQEFDTNGTFVTAWGSQGSGPGQFDQADGLAVSSSGRIYVSDSLNFRIQVFSSPGVFLEQFGSLGTNTGQFDFPGVIAVDSSNNLYVVDAPGGAFDNYRVQKFDADGNFLLQWGPPGVNPSGTIQVGGISTDAANNIYVADGANNRIQKFTSSGVLLSEWGSLGAGAGELNGPLGVALDPGGKYVYVADYYNSRVDVFSYAPLPPLVYQSPTNQVVPAGTTLTIDAGISGATPLAYQWRFNGTNLDAATDSVLVISNVPLTASGGYSITASNSLGVATSAGALISVVPAVVTTLPVGNVSATGAVLDGHVWLGSNPTTAWFEWGTNTSYDNLGGFIDLSPDITRYASLPLTNLQPAVVYHYRVAASNDLGVVYGQDLSFQVGTKPAVVTLPPIPSGPGTVLLSASVNPAARDTIAYFQWGRYGQNQYSSPTNQLLDAVTPLPIQFEVTNLQPGTLYQVQAVASNELGATTGAIQQFVAPPWVLLPAPPDHQQLSVSADGTRLATMGAGHLYLSSDSGQTWNSNNVASGFFFNTVSMSADGSRLVVGSGGSSDGSAYFTTNSGQSWVKANGPIRHWYALASSADGSFVAAADPSGEVVLTSTNSGLDWQTNSPAIAGAWDTIATSANGQELIVGAGGLITRTQAIYTSRDAGISWKPAYLPAAAWHSVASSADGKVLLAAVGGVGPGPIYVSTDAGASWAETTAPITNWQRVAISADGSKLAALARQSAVPVFTSTNLGLTWEPGEVLPQANWTDLVMSADGAKIFIAGDQHIFRLQTPTAPNLQLGVEGGQLSLSWVVPSAPIVLQQTADLTNPQWTNTTASPVLDLAHLRYQLSVPPSSPSGFFRLQAAP